MFLMFPMFPLFPILQFIPYPHSLEGIALVMTLFNSFLDWWCMSTSTSGTLKIELCISLARFRVLSLFIRNVRADRLFCRGIFVFILEYRLGSLILPYNTSRRKNNVIIAHRFFRNKVSKPPNKLLYP